MVTISITAVRWSASKCVEALAIADYRSPRNATRSRNGNRPLLIVLMTSPAPMSLQHMLWCGIFITVVCYQLFHCDFWYRDGSSAQVTYTVTDCDANSRELPVEVTRGGLLTTNSFVGQACLLVSSVEDFGLNDFGVNQSALVHIKVYIFWLLNLM